MQLHGAGDTAGFFRAVQRSALMRVLAVAQHIGAFPDASGESREGGRRVLLSEPGGNGQVIARGVLEGRGCQSAAFGEGEALPRGCGNDFVIAGWVDHYRNGGVVLGGGAHHREIGRASCRERVAVWAEDGDAWHTA